MPKQQKVRKRKGKDLDEIHDDLKPQKYRKLTKDAPLDEDLPGQGQFYCVECARHFIDQENLDNHKRTKLHKKKLKELKDIPYTVQEAEAAGGLGSFTKYYNLNRRNKSGKDDIIRNAIVLSSNGCK